MDDEKINNLSEQDKKDILLMDEVTTYFLINECGNFVHRMNHEISKGNISEGEILEVTSDVKNINEVQKFAVENLGRFGVDPKSAKDRVNGNYWKWYGFWDNWKNGLPEEDWKVVASGNYVDYLPTKKWNEE